MRRLRAWFVPVIVIVFCVSLTLFRMSKAVLTVFVILRGALAERERFFVNAAA